MARPKKKKTRTVALVNRRHPAERYAEDVLSGRIPAGTYVRSACQRYFHDLKTGHKRGLKFNRDEAQHVIDWVHSFCRHSSGEWIGRTIHLEPWQQFIYWNLFGWINTREDKSRFRLAYVEVPKKNGKTTGLLAPIGIYKTFFEGEGGAEGYYAASAFRQSKIAFEDALRMVSQDEWLSRELISYKLTIENPVSFSNLHPVPARAEKLDGKRVHFAGVDEYHTAPTSDVFDILYRGMTTRRRPLTLVVTTAGVNTEGPCYQMHQMICNMLDGLIENDSTFGMIYGIDDGDDWLDERTWIKANPSIGVTKTLGTMREEFNRSKALGSVQVDSFKTKELNVWLHTSSTWIQDEDVKRAMQIGEKNKYTPMLAGLPCSLGLDCASSEDITAVAQVWNLGGDQFYGRVQLWLPKDTYDRYVSMNEKHPLVKYVQGGHIQLTAGNVTDYQSIRRYITGHFINSEGRVDYDSTCVTAQHMVQVLMYDKWNAYQLAQDLTNDGVNTQEHRQGFISMNIPCKSLAEKIIGKPGKFFLEENPALRWMFRNVYIERDGADNIKINKKKSKEKVDGVVALVMALSGAMMNSGNALVIPDDFQVPTL